MMYAATRHIGARSESGISRPRTAYRTPPFRARLRRRFRPASLTSGNPRLIASRATADTAACAASASASNAALAQYLTALHDAGRASASAAMVELVPTSPIRGGGIVRLRAQVAEWANAQPVTELPRLSFPV